MEGFTVEKERRENTRFMVEGNEVAVLGPLKEGLGVVIELSLSGFSFKCEEEEDVLKNNVDNLTFFGFQTLNLGKVSLTTVSDEIIRDEEGNFSFRRCGVRFDNLSEVQKKQLRNFIYENAYIELKQ